MHNGAKGNSAPLRLLFPKNLCYANLFREPCFRSATVLGYPVITTERSLTHGGTAGVISGGDETLRARLSLEKAVKADSVPAFWHTAADGLVPVENSLRFAEAYRAASVPFELHIFERGVHGLSLADGETSEGRGTPLYDENAQAWFPLALAWLRLRGFRVR